MKMHQYLFVFVGLAASGCHLSNPSPEVHEEEGREFLPLGRTQEADAEVVEPRKVEEVKLDGSLVPADEPGTIRIVDEPLREVAGVSTGRTWLLELYHSALAEKEKLVVSLADSERERTTATQSLSVIAVERDQLKVRNETLEKRVAELEAQSLELAQRLAESEIARLEARKSELERESRTGRKDRP
jgi:hypothetical protein